MATGLQSTWPRVPMHHKIPCGWQYLRSAPMLTTAIMVHSCPSDSSISRLSSRHARVAEKWWSWIFVNSIPGRNTKSSGMWALGAKCHVCAVCNYNGKTDSQAMLNGWVATILWQSWTEKLVVRNSYLLNPTQWAHLLIKWYITHSSLPSALQLGSLKWWCNSSCLGYSVTT